jgi:hypothetical protein
MAIRIKNWSKHQHFKDRTPPWIKLYRDILDDPDWHELSGDDAKMLVSLWLIASEDDDKSGALPDIRKLAFRLRIKLSQVESAIVRLSQWLIHDDITTISTGYQVDAPETEGERETEKEAKREETPRKRDAPTKVEKPDDVEQQTWTDWLALRKAKKAPVTETVLNGAKREAGKAGMTLEDFLQVWCRRGSQGLEADWLKPEERKGSFSTFAQQAADVARQTVPAKPGKDPALLQIEADRGKAAPIPLEVLEKMARIRSTVPGVQ